MKGSDMDTIVVRKSAGIVSEIESSTDVTIIS